MRKSARSSADVKHTTVMHGCDNVDEDKDLKKQAEEIYRLIT